MHWKLLAIDERQAYNSYEVICLVCLLLQIYQLILSFVQIDCCTQKVFCVIGH